MATSSSNVEIPTINLVREGNDPVEVLLPQITPRSVATLFSVRSVRFMKQLYSRLILLLAVEYQHSIFEGDGGKICFFPGW